MANVRPAPLSTPVASCPAAPTAMTTLFFLWGLRTELNDVLVPHLESIFDLNYFQAMWIQFAFFLGALLFLGRSDVWAIRVREKPSC